MNQQDTPLFHKLRDLTMHKRASFHVPGHKFGRGLNETEHALFSHMMSIDYTEITGLDDLHRPHGIIAEAQQLAAQCFGADHTFFLVNGSTSGNLALILACCDRDDLIIVQRDIHKSVLHGLMLAGAKAVFVSPRIDEQSGLSAGVSEADLAHVLQRYPEAKAVLLTNPSYYGIGVQLERLAALVHKYNMPLLVDEAHGAHYGFHPRLPPSALACGADGVVQSTHKMLGAMTMGAMLHIQGERIDLDAVRHRLAMVQSSSPSYPILASLDISRRTMALTGNSSIEQGLQAVNQFTENLQRWPWFVIAAIGDEDVNTQDPFKIALKDTTGTLTGFELQRALEQHHCMVEMADTTYVLLTFSLNSTLADSEMLSEALCHISRDFRLEKQELSMPITNSMILPPMAHSLEPVAFDMTTYERSERRTLPLADAVAKRSADMIIPYPPGIPVVYPGEVITEEMVHYLQQLLQQGAQFQGSAHIYEDHLQVIDDREKQGGML